MLELRPFRDTELQVNKSLFLDYCVLGGMPDVVRGYIETGTFSGSLDTQEQMRLDYEEDVRKYAQGLDQTKIIRVDRSIPAQLAKENKKFQFNKMNRNARSREYTGCIEWLILISDSQIIYIYTFPYFCAFMMKEYLKSWN